MPILTRSEDRSKLTEKDVQPLGTVAGWQYVCFDGAEFILDQTALESGLVSRPCAENEIRLVAHRTRMTLGTLEEFTETVRGLAVPSGTFAQLAEKAARVSARDSAAHRQAPVDTLAGLPFLAGRSDRVVAVSLVPGRMPGKDRIADLLTRLASKGIALTVLPSGKLFVSAEKGRLMTDQAEAIRTAERLIVGRLIGAPVPCELDHGKATPPVAVTLLAVNIAACAEHAAGTPEVH